MSSDPRTEGRRKKSKRAYASCFPQPLKFHISNYPHPRPEFAMIEASSHYLDQHRLAKPKVRTHKWKSLRRLKRKEPILGGFDERLCIKHRHRRSWCQPTEIEVTLADPVVPVLFLGTPNQRFRALEPFKGQHVGFSDIYW